MKFELEGLDEIKRKLNDLEKRAKDLDGEHQVPFNELFPTEFMRKYTDFGSISDMLNASGFEVKTTEDLKNIPDTEWEAFVSKRTRFTNWKEMQTTATKQYITKKLGL